MVIRRGRIYYTNFSFRGRRVRTSTGTADREAAEQVEARLKQQHWLRERLGERPERTWKEAVVKYADEKHDKRSLTDDLRMLMALTPTLDATPLAQITPSLVEDAVAAAERARIAENKHRHRNPKPTSPARKNRYRAVVRHLLRLAETEWEWIERAPRIRLKREQRPEPRWLTPNEAEALIAAAPEHWRAPIRFALATGLRSDNVFGLLWRWVDLTRGLVIIPKKSFKAKRTHTVPLNDVACHVLNQCKGLHPTHVFTYNGRPFKPAADHWHKVCARAGLEGVTFHTLRHTWASWHVMSGTSLYDLMHLGGWSTMTMVERYAHLDAGHLARSAGNIVGTKLVTAHVTEDEEISGN